MINNDQLFWGFVLYDLIKSIVFLGFGIKWGFDYGLKHVDQLTEAAIAPKKKGLDKWRRWR